jgi:hypothetical protein
MLTSVSQAMMLCARNVSVVALLCVALEVVQRRVVFTPVPSAYFIERKFSIKTKMTVYGRSVNVF